MKLLFVTYRFPAYTHDAACNTVFHLVKHFSQRHEVSLVALAPSQAHADQRTLVGPYCHRIETVILPRWRAGLHILTKGLFSTAPLQMSAFWSPALAARVRQVIAEEQIDLAYAYHLRSAQYLAPVSTIPRCVALQPAQVLHFRRRKQHIRHPVRRLAYVLEASRLRGYELRTAQKFDTCLLISEIDRRAIDPKGMLTNVLFNPHGVDPDYFAPNPVYPKEPHTLVFTGALSIDTNTDAIRYFCESIYPLIKRQIPNVKLYIVGKNPSGAVQALATDPSIIVTGYVEDLRPYLWRAQVAIDSLRVGAGLQNKVLEAMAAGLPMVATSIANEGIGAVHNKNIILADEPQTFADAVINLLDDATARHRIGVEARNFILRSWSWESYFDPLEQRFYELVEAHHSNFGDPS